MAKSSRRSDAVLAELPTVDEFTVDIAHAFGSHCGKGLRDAALFGDRGAQFLAQPVGRHLAIRHVATGESTFTVESNRVQAVTAWCMARDRSLLAVCELCNSVPSSQVSIYELGPSAGTRPVRTLEELGSVGRLDAVAMSSAESSSFEENSLLCLACAGMLEPLIIVLDWQRNEVLSRSELRFPIDRICFSPQDSRMISTSGSDTLKFWALCDKEEEVPAKDKRREPVTRKELKMLPEVSSMDAVLPATFTDHAWLEPYNGMVTASTSEGLIHMISSGSGKAGEGGAQVAREDSVPFFVTSINNPFGIALTGTAALCIKCFNEGFIVGGSAGTLAVWTRQVFQHGDDDADDLDSPVFLQDSMATLVTRTPGAAASVALSDVASLDFVGGREEGEILLGFTNSDITVTKLSILRQAEESEVAVAAKSLISGGFHSGPIISIDVAVQRPVFVSVCRDDSSVKVWDYHSGRCDLRISFPGEELTGAALHPFGFLVAIGFPDRIRLLQILDKELKPFRELPVRGVRSIHFSNGGHFIALVQSKLVLVFSSRTLKRLATLRGHPGQVVSMSFDPDDKLLVTVGDDGSYSEWNTHTWNKVADAPSHGDVLAIAAGPNGCSWFGVVDDEKYCLRSYSHGVFKEVEDIVLPTKIQLVAIKSFTAASQVSVLSGDSSGALRAFVNLKGIIRSKEFGLHSSSCTAIAVAADGKTVISAGEDGSIFVLRVTGLGDVATSAASLPQSSSRGSKAARKIRGGSEVIMINRGEIQQRKEEMYDLTAKVTLLKSQLDDEAARLQSECRIRVEEARKKDQERVQSLRLKYESLQQASTSKERDTLRQMKALQAAHIQGSDELEKVYDRRLRLDTDRYIDLEAEIKDLAIRLVQAREKSVLTLDAHSQKLEQEHQKKIEEKDAEIQQLKDLIKFTQQRFDTMLDQEGMEQALELSGLNRKNQEELAQQDMVEYRLKKEQDTLTRGLDMMEKDLKRLSQEKREAIFKVNALNAEAEKLQHEVTLLKAERKECELNLREKEVEISSQKLKVQTLKKFKHVLDYRLREVSESLRPKEEMIQQLHAQLRLLEAEFEKELDAQKQLENRLEKKCEQVTVLASEAEKLKHVMKQRERKIFQFVSDLSDLATQEQDTRQWHIGLKKIWQTHVDLAEFNKEDETFLPRSELARQLQTMERKSEKLALAGLNTETTCKADIVHKTQENMLLIHELDELRVEKKALEKKAKELEQRVREAEKKLSDEKDRAQKLALADIENGSAVSRQPSRSSSAGGLPKAVREFFEEAPNIVKAGPKGTLRKVPKKVTSKSEHIEVKQILRLAEENNGKLQMERIENKFLSDQLYRLKQRQ